MEQLRIDLVPMGVTPNAHASQFDVGRVIRFLLYNGGTAYTLAGTETITVKMAKPDGTEETVSVTNTSSNYVDFITTDGLLNQAGLYPCEISITSGTDVIGSKNFNLRVELDPYDGHNIRRVTVGPADICTFDTTFPEPYQSVTVNVEATGGNGTPDNPNPIVGYSSANIVNTQNDSIVDLFSIDSDFRGTVAFNQLIQYETTERNGIRATMDSNGVVSFSGTSIGGYSNITKQHMPIVGHKYFISKKVIENPNNVPFYWDFLNTTTSPTQNPATPTSTINILNILSATGSSTGIVGFSSNTDFTGLKAQIICVDLTQMFGSTIADYIYGLEQNNAGEGVAFFRSIYPEDYYAYDSGTTEIVGKETPEATISFGQTVYGGVLDVTNGKLRITHNRPAFDGSENWWVDGDNTNRFGLSSELTPTANYTTFKANYLTPSLWGTIPNSFALKTNGSLYVMLDNTAPQMTLAEFKTYLSNNPLQIWFELATPFDIDLTPVQIRALVGVNNVFADCGETEVEYLTEGT